MRASFAAMVGLALFATACGSSNGTTTTTTGGLIPTMDAGGASPGTPCTYNGACQSGICDLKGSGNCCSSMCTTGDPTCGATGCDSNGTCIYPQPTVACGSACTNFTVTPSNCDGSGTCTVGSSVACPGNFSCGKDGGCNTTCIGSGQCASGSVCNNGTCGATVQFGACTENDDCKSGFCGPAGTGDCCAAQCLTANTSCGATACTAATGDCVYPDAGTSCGPTESCAGGVQTDAAICDGQGNCPSPPTAQCIPFVCGPSACLTKCMTSNDCTSGDFCDVAHAGCCTGLNDLGAISVDAILGTDAACCGIGGKNPCQTLAHAMQLIDSAQAQNVTITASVNGPAGGNWPSSEGYPIVLGWGAELKAPGVYFTDTSDGGDAAIFDIKVFSSGDVLGSASIAGAQGNPVWIGMAVDATQAVDPASIKVENGGALNLAYANINSSATHSSTAILVEGGGALVLGEDLSTTINGVVNIGNNGNTKASDGYNGIVCGSAANLGCTISDVGVAGGSLDIEGQEGVDIDAEDYANINLSSSPVIGVTSLVGFLSCPAKPDAEAKNGPAVLLHGKATMTYEGTVQCISGDGFDLTSSSNGAPSLTLKKSTIENTETGIHAFAGTATVSSSSIQYNVTGVEQDATASIDLNGGMTAATATTVACASNTESVLDAGTGTLPPGVAVLNTGTAVLTASNVEWDTSGPDVFLCNPLSSSGCMCESQPCTDSPGADGMDAVYESTGLITTTGNLLSSLDCAPGIACGSAGTCTGTDVCCNDQGYPGCYVCTSSDFCFDDCEED